MLAFLIKASVAALRKFPDFNALAPHRRRQPGLQELLQHRLRRRHAERPRRPGDQDADQKGVLQIAKEMSELSAKAREGKLGPADMQGGCFSISSLGGIGGTAFTPIINAPEVAILGVSKSATKPVWNGKEFVPRLMRAALALLRSPRHRRRGGGALHRVSREPARGPSAGDGLVGYSAFPSLRGVAWRAFATSAKVSMRTSRRSTSWTCRSSATRRSAICSIRAPVSRNFSLTSLDAGKADPGSP